MLIKSLFIMPRLSPKNHDFSFDSYQQTKSHYSPLHAALLAKQWTQIPVLLKDNQFKEWLSIQNDDGNTPLHLALENGASDDICLNLIQKETLSIKNKNDFHPLFLALKNQRLEIAEAILNRLDIIQQNPTNDLPREEVLYELITSSLNGLDSSMGLNLLTLVSGYIDLKLPISSQNHNTLTHLLVNWLVKELENPGDPQTKSHLMEFLFKHGDLSARNIFNQTPLDEAISNPKFMALLVERDASQQDDTGNTLWHHILNATHEGVDSHLIEKKLIGLLENPQKKFDINFPNAQGATLLHMACLNKQASIASDLIRAGANPEQKDNHGFPPLAWCLYNFEILPEEQRDALPNYYDSLSKVENIVHLLPSPREQLLDPEFRRRYFAIAADVNLEEVVKFLIHHILADDADEYETQNIIDDLKNLQGHSIEIQVVLKELKLDELLKDHARLLKLYIEQSFPKLDWLFLAANIPLSEPLIDGKSLLEYIEETHPIPLSEKLRFVAQSIGRATEKETIKVFESNPYSAVKAAGYHPNELYPILTRYAQSFLNTPEVDFSHLQKQNVLRRMLMGSAGRVITPVQSMTLFKKEKFLNVQTGFDGHYIPVVFFEINRIVFEGILNRGGERRKEASLILHKINPERLDAKKISQLQETKQKSRNESAPYIYEQLLQEVQATGHDLIADLFIRKIGQKKDQSGYNCALVGSTGVFELQMIFEMIGDQDLFHLETILDKGNTYYKWFSLFCPMQAMIESYEAAIGVEEPFDLKFEGQISANIESRYERLTHQFQEVPKIIQNTWKAYLNARKNFFKELNLNEPVEQYDGIREFRRILRSSDPDLKELDQLFEKKEFFKNSNFPPLLLIEAIHQGNEKTALYLLEKNPNVRVKTDDGLTPLLAACYKKMPELAKKIIRLDAATLDDVSPGGMTPLSLAFQGNDPELIKLLMENNAKIPEAGADLDRLVNALITGSEAKEVLEQLMTFGVKVSPSSLIGVDGLFEALLSPSGSRFDIEAGIFGNRSKKLDAFLNLLLEQGLDPNLKDSQGNTLLLRLLGASKHLKAGCHLPYKEHLHYFGTEYIHLILKHGADVTMANADGITPLHLAALNGDSELITLLLEKGAKPDAKDSLGKTPLDWFNKLHPSDSKVTALLR